MVCSGVCGLTVLTTSHTCVSARSLATTPHGRLAHHGLARHHALPSFRRARSRLIVLLQFVALQCLLVLKLFLCVFVALEDLIVFDLAQLETLVHLALQLLAQRVHLDLLLLHQLRLRSQDLLVPRIHELLAFLFLELVRPLLDLMGLLVVLLFGKVCLDLSQVEQLSRLLEDHGQSLFEDLAVLLQLVGVLRLQLFHLLLVLCLRLLELQIVVLVELLVLLDVGLLDFFLALLVREHELLVLHVELLLLELEDAVFGHFSL